MARDYFINGESLVSFKGNSASSIGSLTQLGLSTDPIRVTLELHHKDIIVDAWGPEVPADVQQFLAAVTVNINFIHIDRTVLDYCLQESMGGTTAVGTLARAGLRLGGGVSRFAVGNHYIGLNISSPVAAKPWRFYFAYLTGTPVDVPLGTEKSVISTTWRVIPYTTDPYGGGTGSLGTLLWDHILDT